MPINSFLYPGVKVFTPFTVDNSLRFDDGSSDYLSRTPSSAGDTKTLTISMWVKLSAITTNRHLICEEGGGTDRIDEIKISNADVIRIENYNDSGSDYGLVTSQVLRDTNAFYHIVVAFDSTQATASDRIKLYVNGSQVTSFSSSSYPSLNYDFYWNSNTDTIGIGADTRSPTNYFDGYMAECVLIDGQALDPTSFGEFDADSGIWKPIDVSGLLFGTNGFYLPFQNSAALGQDDSGNGNNFTVNNLTSIDQTTDTPTNNFCTLNPLIGTGTYTDSQTYSNGNTIVIPDATDTYATAFSTLGVQGSGKWYWEAQIVWNGTSNNANFPRTIGFCTENYAFNYSYLGQDQESWGMIFSDDSPDQWFASHPDENNNVGGTMANGDIVNLALDLDNGYFYFGVNGTYLNSGDPTSGASGTGAVFTLTATDLSKNIIPAVTNATNTTYYKFNFGNPAYTISSGNSDADGYGNFEYSVPNGYYALNSKNLAEYG